jgi:transposase
MRGKKRYIKLTESQRQALQKGFEQGKKPAFRKRCHIILLSDQGYSVQQISALYKLSRLSVGQWFDRYEKDGIESLHTNKGQGRPSILRIDNEVDVQNIERLLEQNAQNLKPALAELERNGKPMSKRTLQRFLKKVDDAGNASAEAL